MKQSRSRVLIWTLGLVAVAGVVGYLRIVRPLMLETRQVRNHGDTQHLSGLVERHREEFGQFPKHLSQLVAPSGTVQRRDAWGHEFHYETRGGAYVLVSFGRDGKPDGTDYWALRSAGDRPSDWRICGEFDRDEVVSDVGYLRVCGK